MLDKQTTSEEVASYLRKLTNASRLERLHDNADLRRQAEQSYRSAYTWLESHNIAFEYDKTQRCYVEVEVSHA